jgi:hypothetical protein
MVRFWPDFNDYCTRLDTAANLKEAESILREAKSQFQCGKLSRDQLQALRDKYHLRKERGEIAARA